VERPIGYWVKSLDRLLEGTLDDALGQAGIGRRHWQTLNVLAEAARTEAEVATELAPFVTADPIAAPSVLADLVRLGWAAPGERFALTDEGRAALNDLRAEVARLRRRATDGLSEDDYRTTVATLRRMTQNLSPTG